MLLADIQRAVTDKTDVILFNIDSQGRQQGGKATRSCRFS